MRQIFFKKPFMQLIKEGKKTSTIRAHSRVQKGDNVLLMSGRDHLRAHVTNVDKIPLGLLTTEMAQTDGFISVNELLNTLANLYPGETLKQVFYITFTLES